MVTRLLKEEKRNLSIGIKTLLNQTERYYNYYLVDAEFSASIF